MHSVDQRLSRTVALISVQIGVDAMCMGYVKYFKVYGSEFK